MGVGERRHTEPNLDPKANKQPTQSGVFVGFQTEKGGVDTTFSAARRLTLLDFPTSLLGLQFPTGWRWLLIFGQFLAINSIKSQIYFQTSCEQQFPPFFLLLFSTAVDFSTFSKRISVPFLCQKKCAFSDWISPESNHRPVRNKWKVIFIAGSNELFLCSCFFSLSCRPKKFPSTSCWVEFDSEFFPELSFR